MSYDMVHLRGPFSKHFSVCKHNCNYCICAHGSASCSSLYPITAIRVISPPVRCSGNFGLCHSNLLVSQNVRILGLIKTEAPCMSVAVFLVKGLYKLKVFSYMLSDIGFI